MGKLRQLQEKALTLAKETRIKSSSILQSTAEKSAELIKQAGTMSAQGADAALESIHEKFDGFKTYVESEEFERDLDALGVRMGISSERLLHKGENHWERTYYKLELIGKQAALDTYLRDQSDLKFMLAKLAFKRFLPQVNAAITIAQSAQIAFHCYQVYSNRKAEAEVA